VARLGRFEASAPAKASRLALKTVLPDDAPDVEYDAEARPGRPLRFPAIAEDSFWQLCDSGSCSNARALGGDARYSIEQRSSTVSTGRHLV
jgi:hypothetical protein